MSFLLYILIFAFLFLIARLFYVKIKEKGLKKRIEMGLFPLSEKEEEIYQHYALNSDDYTLRVGAAATLFNYYLKEYSGDRTLLDKALRWGEEISRLYPDRSFYEDVMFETANLYYFEKYDFSRAEKLFKELKEKRPSSRWGGICEERVKLIADNLENEEALKLYVTAEKFFEKARYKDARQYLDNILEKYTQAGIIAPSLLFLADIYYYKFSRLEDAYSCYKRLYEEFPGHYLASKALYKAAEILRRKKDWKGALENYHTYVKKYPDRAGIDDAYFYIGDCYQNMGEHRKAKNAYSLILGDFPDSKWTDVIYHRVKKLNSEIGFD
ncbi:MAG: tetratricopeptide repeat protein [Elusimicrobiota bacterium]